MPISRDKKIELVAELAQRLTDTSFAAVSNYRGLKVAELQELRKQLRAIPAEFQVVKNALAKRAVEDTSLAVLVDYFDGPSSLTLATSKEVESARVLKNFTKAFPQFELRAGMLNGRLLSSAELADLAEVPSREVLLARAVGCFASPVSGFIGVARGLLQQVLYVMQAIHDQKAAA